jgi:SAM-dependent methyltransferase
VATGGTFLSRLRGAIKSAVYSGPRRDRWQDPARVVDALGLEEGRRVADLGAGGGYFTYRLARAVGPEGRVFAVDTDPDMRLRIRERAQRKGYPQIVTVAADADDPALPEPVDLVLVVDAFHHLHDERAAYLRGLADHLRPGGRVAVIEPPPRWFLFGHATDPADIRATMSAAGYEMVAEHDFLARQSFQVFAPAS